MNDAASTLTLQDIADLAGVRRPVVTMWRRRPVARGERVPFPEAVTTSEGVQRFDRRAVEQYLRRTRRGNNREYAYDAPALAVPVGVDLEDLVTLLCWYAMTGKDLAATTAAERTAAAREVDPGDTLLLREIQAMTASQAVLGYVDGLVEASYGAGDALTRLESGRLGRERARRDLTGDAIDLLRQVVGTCAAHLGADGLWLLDSHDASLSLTLADPFQSVRVDGDTAEARALRRRATIREVELSNDPDGPRLEFCSLLGLEEHEALDRLDRVVLDLATDHTAVVLGPASVLCEKLRGEADNKRSETLRLGALSLALRLPRGLWREAHRQSLGIWVCRGEADIPAPRVADLSGIAEADLDLGDLAADMAGALDQTGARAYRYARRIELSRVLAGGPVVPRGARPPRLGRIEQTAYVDRVHEATLDTSRPLQLLDVLVAPGPGTIVLRQRSLGELRDDKHLIMRRGSRIDPGHANPAGTVLVLPQDMTAGVTLDAFDAARLYPRATRTEPGDVIFVEKPRPRAWVDSTGGSLVASPARILRLAETAGFGAYVLASVINLAPQGSEWETWNVPDLPRDEVDRLEVALVAAEQFETEARTRVDAAVRLRQSLVEGVAAGALTLAEPTADVMIREHEKEVS